MNITLSLAWNGEAQWLRRRLGWNIDYSNEIGFFFCSRTDWVRPESKRLTRRCHRHRTEAPTDSKQKKKKNKKRSHGCNYVHSGWIECEYVILQIIVPDDFDERVWVRGHWVVAPALKMATRSGRQSGHSGSECGNGCNDFGTTSLNGQVEIDQLSDKQRRMGQTFFNSLRDD